MARLKRLGAMPNEVVSQVRGHNSRRTCGLAESLKIFLNDIFLGHLIFLIAINRLPTQAERHQCTSNAKAKSNCYCVLIQAVIRGLIYLMIEGKGEYRCGEAKNVEFFWSGN
jgi:hypothetical protein